MTTPITKEQLQRIIESADDVLSALAGTNEDVHPESDDMIRLWDYLNDVAAPPEVVRELARIALASLEAEPVAWLLSGGGAKNNVSFDSGDAYADPLREVTPLYTAPPAPPAYKKTENFTDYHAGWNACRAAILQAGNHTEQHLDMVNSPVIPDGWVMVPVEPTAAMNKAGWAAINEHDEINPTYRAMLAAAPQHEVKK